MGSICVLLHIWLHALCDLKRWWVMPFLQSHWSELHEMLQVNPPSFFCSYHTGGLQFFLFISLYLLCRQISGLNRGLSFDRSLYNIKRKMKKLKRILILITELLYQIWEEIESNLSSMNLVINIVWSIYNCTCWYTH